MTAPARSRGRARPRTQPVSRARARTAATAPAVEPDTPDVAPPRRRSTAAERAYARRAQRVQDLRRSGAAEEPRGQRLRLRWPRSRASFVLLLMALMAAGVATTLWLSTQAIADSYRLEQLRQNNAGLAEQAEKLRREVASAESPSSLAERAGAIGMVPGGNPARLVVQENGKVKVVGEPIQATPSAPAPDPEPPPETPAGDDSTARDQQNAPQDQQDQQSGHGQQGDRQQEEQGTTGGD